MFTCWSNDGDNSPWWKLGFRFLKSVSLADQRVERPWSKSRHTQRWRDPDQKADAPKGGDTLIKRWRCPNLGFWSHCHLLIKRWRQPPSESWNLGFWSQCHLLIKQWNTLIKKLQHPKWRHPDQKAETPKLRFLQSVCHLLIKWWRQLPLLKVGT